MLSDAAVARRAAGGSQRAFAAIFERYHQDLYRYCAAILGNPEDAHDAVQNTMLKALRSLPGERRQLKLKPWLYRIAHNEAIDMIRARKSDEPVEAEVPAATAGPAEEFEARSRLQQLISDIGDLPTRQRSALVMREMGGLDYEQIGEALRTSPAVARQTIYEARLSLRQMSEGREMPCEEAMRAISDNDGRVLRRRDLRAHLSRCETCRAFRAEIDNRRREFASLAPMPVALSAGILQSVLGGTAGTGATSAAGGAAGAAAGKALASSAAIKSAAAVLAVSAIGIVAADRQGTIDLGLGDRRLPAANEAAGRSETGGQAASTARPRPLAGAVGPAVPASRPSVRRAAAVAKARREATVEPGSAEPAAEQQPPRSSGRHLGQSKGSEQAESPGKSDNPAKETKGASAAAPGQSKSPGKAKHAAADEEGGHAANGSHPVHPEHPAHPEHPQTAAAPEPEAEPPAEAESGDEDGRPEDE